MNKLPRCPVEVTLSLIDDRWKVLIIRELLYGTKRFGEIRKALGKVSTKVLTANLRSMEDGGLLIRKVYPEVPPKVEYTLTERGLSLKPILFAMVQWGSDYKYDIEGETPVRTTDGQIIMITKGTKEDLPEILELQYLSYQSEAELLGNYNIPPLKQTLLEVENELNAGIILKAINEINVIVGSVRGKTENGTLYIGKLIVRPDMQKRGIGKSLLAEIERICSHERCELFTSSKSEENIQFYQRNGYSIFKEQVITNDLKFIYLEK